MRWRYGCAALAAAVMLGLVLPGMASAHILKQDNGISVVMHIRPDDNPKPLEPTTIELVFAQNNQFRLDRCRCSLSLEQPNRTVSISPLTSQRGSNHIATATVRFPQAGAYYLVVHGTSTDGSFPEFNIRYTTAVNDVLNGSGGRDSSSARSVAAQQVLLLSATSLLTLFAIASYTISQGGRYRSPVHKTNAKRNT